MAIQSNFVVGDTVELRDATVGYRGDHRSDHSSGPRAGRVEHR